MPPENSVPPIGYYFSVSPDSLFSFFYTQEAAYKKPKQRRGRRKKMGGERGEGGEGERERKRERGEGERCI